MFSFKIYIFFLKQIPDDDDLVIKTRPQYIPTYRLYSQTNTDICFNEFHFIVISFFIHEVLYLLYSIQTYIGIDVLARNFSVHVKIL